VGLLEGVPTPLSNLQPRAPGQVVPLFAPGSDEALVAGLKAGEAGARGELFDRYGAHVQRVLARVLGVDQELGDLLHDVFIEAFSSIQGLGEPKALRGWLTSIAVFTARACIRRRKRRSWLRLVGWEALPEQAAPVASGDVSLAMTRVYAVLGAMDEDERIAFALRFIEGMELTEVAEACGVSLATIKRRLGKAEEHFRARAAKEPALQRWLEGEG